MVKHVLLRWRRLDKMVVDQRLWPIVQGLRALPVLQRNSDERKKAFPSRITWRSSSHFVSNVCCCCCFCRRHFSYCLSVLAAYRRGLRGACLSSMVYFSFLLTKYSCQFYCSFAFGAPCHCFTWKWKSELFKDNYCRQFFPLVEQKVKSGYKRSRFNTHERFWTNARRQPCVIILHATKKW